jgi:glyoxylase-like metal-dependent hydrolase (beta-lactamase superfamily II)
MARAISLLAAFAFGSTAFAQGSPIAPLPFVLKELGPGVYAAIDGPEHKAGSNSGFVIGDDGVLVIDAFFHEDAARALVAQIHRLTSKPIRYVVNTHYHLDHTGGDAVFRSGGAIIIAHRNVRDWLRSNNALLFGSAITPELRAQIAALPLPDLVTDKDLTVWLGSRKIVVRTVLGHTGGDLTIYVPDAKVLFTGDLLWRKIPPNLIDGSVAEWTATDADFAAMPDSQHIRYVPGHGDVADIRDVREFRQYLLRLRQLVNEGRQEGLSGEALVRAVLPKLKASYPGWPISDRAGSAEVRYMDEELAGTKRRPMAQPD